MSCEDCQYAYWDYCEYYGGYRQYFPDGCKVGKSPEECEEEAEEDAE